MDCIKCGLNRKFHVPGVGSEKVDVAILGEAPGREEVRKKEPFVGESGKLLFATLGQAGLTRKEVYTTNVCKCQPTGNAKPSRVQMQCCAGANGTLLVEELKQRGVKLVIALGNTALEILTGHVGITKYRGQPMKALADPNLCILPTFHPAAILRNVNYFPDFAADLTRAVALVKGQAPSEVRTGPIRVIDNVDEAVAFLDKLRDQPIVFDVETSGYDHTKDYILSMVFSCSPTDATVITGNALYEPEVQDKLKVMESPERHIQWIGHNAQFDAVFIKQQLGVRPCISFDTLLAHYALDEVSTHDLKVLAAAFLGAPDWEADMSRYLTHPKKDSFAMLPPEVLHRYNGLDGMFTFQLYDMFHAKLDEVGAEDLKRLFYQLLMPATNALVDLTLDGIKVNPVRLEELKVKAIEDAHEAHVAMTRLLGRSFNPDSPAQVQIILYDTFHAPTADRSMVSGVPPELTAPAGMAKLSPRTTAMFQLERLTYQGGKLGEFCTQLVRYRRSTKLASTYLANYVPGTDGRIHPSYLLFGTVTGRLASTRPNVLNLPHVGGIRSLIVPEPGNVILVADYSQNELRVLAAMSGAPGLAQIYRDQLDIHDEVSKSFYGPEYSKKQRMIAKSFNFGLVYGRGAYSMAQAFGLGVNEAEEMMETLRARMGIAPWIQKQHQTVLDQGYVSTPLGRRRRFPLITEQNVAEVRRQAVNAPIQGTGSDLMLLSLIEINTWIRQEGGKILFPVHDSIAMEVPAGHVVEIAKRVRATMLGVPARVLNTDVAWKVDLECGPSYDEADLQKLEVP